MRRREALGGAAAAAALAAAGLVAGGARAADEPAAVVVDIRDYKFVPDTVTVKPGSTVRWTNSERRTTHSILFTGDGGFESDRMFPGDAWQRRFEKPGRYPYTCGPHPEMKGLVVVDG